MLTRVRRGLAAHPRRVDAVVAAAFAAVSLAQVLVIAPIGPRGTGALVALVSTVPIAFRRTHPLPAAIAGSVIWLVHTDGYVWLGYVAAFLLFYSAAAYAAHTRHAVAVAA